MTGEKWQGVIIGRPESETEPVMKIPLMPGLAPEAQYQRPDPAAFRLMTSYVRYATRLKHPDNPDWPIVKIFAYRVLHTIPAWPFFINGADPNDAITFRPIFVGEFDGKGLMSANDPLTFWMLPTIRARPQHPDSPAWCWCRAHAYDPNFIYRPETKTYGPWTPDLAEQFPKEWVESVRKYRPGLDPGGRTRIREPRAS